MVGMGGTTPPLQKQMKMKEEPPETMLADEVLMTVYSLAHSAKGREEEIGLKDRTNSSIGSTNATTISQGCTRVHYVQQRLDKMHAICSRAKETQPTIFDKQ